MTVATNLTRYNKHVKTEIEVSYIQEFSSHLAENTVSTAETILLLLLMELIEIDRVKLRQRIITLFTNCGVLEF
jgi:hypothetical protein